MMKVSIIVPNYNGTKTIRQCLDSVLEQDYPNIELIIIDDGSTDNSVQIIKQLMRKNGSIRLIRLNHRGPNMARKAGVKESTGDYIMFVDSDDYLADGAVRLLVDRFNNYNVDVIRFNAKYQPGGKTVVPVRYLSQDKIVKHDEVVKLLLTTYTFNSLWSQIYKADLIKDSKAFDLDISLGEDLLINADIHAKTEHVLLLTDALYYYSINSQSITHSKNRNQITRNVLDRIFVSDKMIDWAVENGVAETLMREASYNQLRMLWTVMKKLSTIKGYTKEQFLSDFAIALKKDNFSKYSSKDLHFYLNNMTFKQSIVDKRAITALVDRDYAKIWKYIRVYGMIKNVVVRRKD